MAGCPPIVHLHGLGLNRTYFRPLMAILARHGIGSVSIDLPGHGRARAVEATDYDEVANHVLRILDQLEVEAFVPFGHSYGGLVALALHRMVPERIPRMVLAATSYEAGPRTIRWSFILLGLPLCKLVNWSVWLRNGAGNPDLDFSDPAITRSDLRCLVATSHATSSDGMARASGVLTGASLEDSLGCVTKPVLLLEPAHDQIFARRSYDRLEKNLPDAFRVGLPGSHHIAREWTRIGLHVIEFLNRVGIPRSPDP